MSIEKNLKKIIKEMELSAREEMIINDHVKELIIEGGFVYEIINLKFSDLNDLFKLEIKLSVLTEKEDEYCEILKSHIKSRDFAILQFNKKRNLGIKNSNYVGIIITDEESLKKFIKKTISQFSMIDISV